MVREDFSEEVTCKLGFEEMSETWTRRGEWGKTGLCEVTGWRDPGTFKEW